MADAAGGLRQPYDIYVAFAFAAADVLFETDAKGDIGFAVGAAKALLGRPARLLGGMNVADLVDPQEKERIHQVVKRMASGQRVRNVVVKVTRDGGSQLPVSVSGYRHPERPERLLLVMGHQNGWVQHADKRVGQSGLLDKDGFQAVASQLANDAGGDDAYQMTLLELPEMSTLRERVGAEAAEIFVAELGKRLQALSVGGDAAGQLSDTKYGVVHGPAVSAGIIEAAVSAVAMMTTPGIAPPSAKAATLVLDVDGVSSEEATRALAYTLNSFSDLGLPPPNSGELAAALQPKLSQTVRQMASVRRMIEIGGFEMLYQPIVDLWTNVVHHFECLIRFEGEGGRSPYETVTFAEDTGLAGRLDMAVLERVMLSMRSGPASHPALRFAVNLSGASLTDPKIVARLRELLVDAKDLRKRLMFELTESAAISDLAAVNGVLQEIRAAGFEVSLDDFGAGSAAFHYLRALKVDNVKIDGSYIKEAMSSNETVSFIKAMVQLCADLGVTTTAEFVENVETANLLKLLKLRYGQGYLFGKPMRPGPPLRDGDTMGPWLTPTTEWRKGLLYYRG